MAAAQISVWSLTYKIPTDESADEDFDETGSWKWCQPHIQTGRGKKGLQLSVLEYFPSRLLGCKTMLSSAYAQIFTFFL